MKVTHLYHSGFFLEFEHCAWLIDYYRGEIPILNPTKKLMVFCSHRHQDHFNPAVFTMFADRVSTEYVLARDIPVRPNYLLKYGVSELQAKQITSVKANEEYRFDDGAGGKITLRTLKSTDSGVAFLLNYQGKCIYHAGDLNWWHWEGDDKQFNHNMAANFKREMEKLRGLHIDAAFVPLDPRLGDAYSWGLDLLMRTADVEKAYPMHFGDDAKVVERFLRDPISESYRGRIEIVR